MSNNDGTSSTTFIPSNVLTLDSFTYYITYIEYAQQVLQGTLSERSIRTVGKWVSQYGYQAYSTERSQYDASRFSGSLAIARRSTSLSHDTTPGNLLRHDLRMRDRAMAGRTSCPQFGRQLPPVLRTVALAACRFARTLVCPLAHHVPICLLSLLSLVFIHLPAVIRSHTFTRLPATAIGHTHSRLHTCALVCDNLAHSLSPPPPHLLAYSCFCLANLLLVSACLPTLGCAPVPLSAQSRSRVPV